MGIRWVTLNRFFFVAAGIFVCSLAVILSQRGGRDLKVGLFGVEQVLQKKSPYDNPTDPNRTIFRYAPGITILERPFLLKSTMVAPFEFRDMTLSIYAWYLLELAALVGCALLLLRLFPSPSRQADVRNLQASFLLALPLIGYELSNSQNKLVALCLLLFAVFFFERGRPWWSSIFLGLAATVYLPLLVFAAFFCVKSRGRYILPLAAGLFLVFIAVPSIVLGFAFNTFLLREWFTHTIQPFVSAQSAASYIDLRISSQSLPSAIDRMFVAGKTGDFHYALPPAALHGLVTALSAFIALVSCAAVVRRAEPPTRGIECSIFLILTLLLPAYCIYYTWAYLFVVYFAVFQYMRSPQARLFQKRLLVSAAAVVCIATIAIGVRVLNHWSFICWATVFVWAAAVNSALIYPAAGDTINQ